MTVSHGGLDAAVRRTAATFDERRARLVRFGDAV